MVKNGRIAFPVILALAAVTGYITYHYMLQVYLPSENKIDSIFYRPLPPAQQATGNNNSGTSAPAAIDESKYTNKVEIKILQGASIQGNPNYDPNKATAASDALITWINQDNTLHTATSGKGSSDSDSGKLFDSKFLQPNAKYSVPASKLGKGDHTYYCQVHPFMTGTITVQ